MRQRHRLERAREMLLLGRRRVTDICLEVGFSSLGSFSSLFSRRFGVSPSQFRRRASGSDPAQHQPGCLALMARAWAGWAGAVAISEKPGGARPCDNQPQLQQRNIR
ncbi:helix-turn-helix domain-containing protein [Luteimonas sp. R10]|uniref:helix-turn-helix domain-containing protein n=1 Tax=Luteimonas sp. R10 TaxID=3108176 RepID=UPI00388DA415